MKKNQYSLIKILFILIILVYGILGLIDGQNFLLLNSVDLMFHEFGHLFFAFGGELLSFFGGTMMQLLIPNIILFYFIFRKSFYSGAVILFWIAVNLFDISIYIKDAGTMDLPLLVQGSTHDWNYILTRFNLLKFDQIIGNFVFTLGIVYLALSILGGIYFSKKRDNLHL